MIKIGKAGSGTYGIVYNAETVDDKRKIAVKRNIVDESVSFSGSLKELDLLGKLKGHPYIVKLLAVSFCNPFTVPSSPICRSGGYNCREDYLHFVFEQGNTSGHTLIYGDGVPLCYLKLAMVQMFLGIEYMHAKGIIHRDIKPSNLLWFVTDDNKAAIKLCDFGLSKMHTPTGPMTPKVVTCWYRAPEICAQYNKYGYPSDIWSAGCIMYEMLSKKALLEGYADDDTKILSKIIGIMPNPTYNEIYKLTQGHKIKLNDEASPRHRKSFGDMINLSPDKIKEFNSLPEKGATYDEYLDLLTKILVLDPDKRLQVGEILDHPFFIPYQDVIKWCRQNYPPKPPRSPLINIICCRERSWACKAAFTVFNERSDLPWYKHNILFQSIDLFDRYLCYISKTESNLLVESKLQGKYLTKYYTELHYIVCLYMSIKYFTTLHVPISFEELASDGFKTTKALIEAEEFEKKMLKDVLMLKIHRYTIYDMACTANKAIPTEHQTRDLFFRYGTIEKEYVDISLTNLYNEMITIL